MKIFGWLDGLVAGRSRRTRVACAILAPALVLASCGTYAALRNTAAERAPGVVDRGPVGTRLSATGSLVAITELRLGFPARGQLSEVLVQVGDRVEAGQVLARVDDFALQQILDQREADLDQAEAELERAQGATSVEAAQATLDQAQEFLSATENEADEASDVADAAVDRAEAQLAFNHKALDRARAQLRADKEACGSRSTTSSHTGSSQTYSPLDLGSARSNDDDSTTSTTTSQNAACDRIAADRVAVSDAEQQVTLSEIALDEAKDVADFVEADGQTEIEDARRDVVAAQNALNAAQNDQPADVSVQQAAVDRAEAAVRLAERDLDKTELIAPTGGVVAAINGNVGEYVDAVVGNTPLSPQSTAPLPDTDRYPADEADAPGAGAFLVLDDVDTFQTVVAFNEADAVNIAPNQHVDVTVPAVPGLTIPGTVLAVAPTGREQAELVTFAVTIVLAHGDPQLRDAMTADAAIYVDGGDDVLRVPSAAVIQQDDGSTAVRVPAEGGGEPVVLPFEAGLRGTEFTEVRSGLDEGQVVLLPAP
jgi:HlyD family secretion protein